jgi:hypothetical protein
MLFVRSKIKVIASGQEDTMAANQNEVILNEVEVDYGKTAL